MDLRARLDAALTQYRVEEQIGEGGMAVVFLAHDLKHDRRVALKIVKPEIGAVLGTERFQREIDIAAKLAHPHVLPLYDSGEVDGLQYLVMPFVEGESLRDRLVRERTLPLPEVVRIVGEVAGALDYAHERGLVHRDVKPENILFQAGHAAVTDFGIARWVDDHDETRLTGTGMAVGTVAYMSPEQAAGDRDVDARADVYAVGCLLYEMLEGRPPFEGKSVQAVLASKVVGEVPPFSAEVKVPPTVSSVVRRALRVSPDDRYATPAELARDLQTAVTTEAIEAAAARRTRRRRFRGAAWVAVLGAVAAGGWWVSTLVTSPRIQRLALLPLANERRDPEQDFFIDGMHDALIAEMGQAGIEVINRRSVMRYRDDETTPVREIVADLDVDAVLEGVAFREGDSVGIRIQLVDGRTETGVWNASFGAPAPNVIAMYRQITAAVAGEIDFVPGAEARARLAASAPVNPAAYEAYLNGMYHWYRLTPQDLDLAQRYFERALELQPDYALAHKGMATLWAGRQQFGLASPEEAGPIIRNALQRAQAVDSTIPEVAFTVASALTWSEFDWNAAEAAFRRTLELNPSYAEARAYFAHLLVYLGRRTEAREQANLAVTLDPLNPLISALGCVTHTFLEVTEAAVERCRAVLRTDPTQPVALDGLRHALVNLRRYDELLALDIDRARATGDEQLAAVMEAGGAEGGFAEAQRRAAETLAARADTMFVPPGWIGATFADAGEYDRALDWLERAREIGDPSLPYIMSASVWEDLVNDVRFRELRRALGLPERS